MVQAIPAGYAGVTPYLIVRDAARAIDFYKKAFGATELMRFPAPGGKIGHAEIKIGDGVVMLADESPEMATMGRSPLAERRSRCCFYVPDVDAVRQGTSPPEAGRQTSDQGPVLRRPQRDTHRSGRAHMDDRDSHRGRGARDEKAERQNESGDCEACSERTASRTARRTFFASATNRNDDLFGILATEVAIRAILIAARARSLSVT
jgi:catechol 2,3-dioxygenase-like lactoylglutathione lyase family enzyme